MNSLEPNENAWRKKRRVRAWSCIFLDIFLVSDANSGVKLRLEWTSVELVSDAFFVVHNVIKDVQRI